MMYTHSSSLVCKSIRLRMAVLLKIGQAGVLDHGRRATHQNESIVTGRGQMLRHHVGVDEASAV